MTVPSFTLMHFPPLTHWHTSHPHPHTTTTTSTATCVLARVAGPTYLSQIKCVNQNSWLALCEIPIARGPFSNVAGKHAILHPRTVLQDFIFTKALQLVPVLLTQKKFVESNGKMCISISCVYERYLPYHFGILEMGPGSGCSRSVLATWHETTYGLTIDLNQTV